MPPSQTQSYVLICADPDAPSGVWFHWVVYNIPAQSEKVDEGGALFSGTLGKNSWGREQYSGPCPPTRAIHRYVFTLYALNAPLNLPPGESADAVLKAAQGHVLAKATLLGVYGH